MLQFCQSLVHFPLVVFIALDDSVCDDQIVFRAKSHKFTVSVSIPNSMLANHICPFIHLLSNPSIEVTGIISLSVLEIELSAVLLSGCCRISPWSLRGWSVLEHTHPAMVVNIPLQRKSHGDYPVTDRCRVFFSCSAMEFPIGKPCLDSFSLFSPLPLQKDCVAMIYHAVVCWQLSPT